MFRMTTGISTEARIKETTTTLLGFVLLANGCLAANAMADGPVFLDNGPMFYAADGQTETSAALAEFAVWEIGVNFSLADGDGHSPYGAQLLGLYDVNITTNDIGGFNHDNLGSGNWDPGSSFDIPGLANSRIDSFMTIGGSVGAGAPTNSTELVGENSESSAFVFGENIAWRIPETSSQGAVDEDLQVMIGRFVMRIDEMGPCPRVQISAEIRYRYGSEGAELSTTESAIFGTLACPPSECEADIDRDGAVDGADLSSLLGSWGELGGSADFNNDGIVDGQDLGYLLGEWGDCP